MPHVNVPRELLEAELARYLAQGQEQSPEAYAGASRHRVLPLLSDFVGCWAVTMSGQLVFFAWEEPDRVAPVSDKPVDAVGANAALAFGSERFPALAGIRPRRPEDAVPCATCDGTGHVAGVPTNVVCACGGLGWLPHASSRASSDSGA